MGDQLPHRVELVIAREDHRFPADGPRALVGLDLPFLDFEVHEALQNVEQAVGLQHLIPQVMRLPVSLDGRVARAMISAAVEGQKDRLRCPSAGGHPCLVGVHREMHKRPFFEGE